MPFEMDRAFYARMYGTIVGDRARPGDTNLLVEVARDEAFPGDETLWGFGKANRSRQRWRAQVPGHGSLGLQVEARMVESAGAGEDRGMALPHRTEDLNEQAVDDEQRLIERHVDLDVNRYAGGRADARLRASGVSVWAIVAHLAVYDGDRDRVAWHFSLSREAVDAALAYYSRNKRFVDARIALNEA
jgi:uncharacterized protein (DUF433 family)